MRKRRTSHRRERNRALGAGVLLLLVCACGLYFAAHSMRTSDELRARTAALRMGDGAAESPGAAGDGDDDDDLATGSILFVPTTGNICRQRLIDNHTWLIRDAGYVICDEAVSWHSGGTRKPYTRTSRVEAIRDGFFKK